MRKRGVAVIAFAPFEGPGGEALEGFVDLRDGDVGKVGVYESVRDHLVELAQRVEGVGGRDQDGSAGLTRAEAPAPFEGLLEDGEEIVGEEGLVHEVEGAGGEALMFVAILIHAGEHDDGDIEGGAAEGELAGDLIAVDVGEHEVEDDSVGVGGGGLKAGPAGERLNVADLLEGEIFTQEFVDFLIIFNDQDGGLIIQGFSGRTHVLTQIHGVGTFYAREANGSPRLTNVIDGAACPVQYRPERAGGMGRREGVKYTVAKRGAKPYTASTQRAGDEFTER